MRIVIIRHADPDYEHNTLTEQGFIEAEALGKMYNASMFDDIYCSTLERAVLTAKAVIKDEKEIKYREWLIEFYHPFVTEDGLNQLNWDFFPSYLNKHPNILFSPNYLTDFAPFKDIKLKEEYDRVIKNFDEILLMHGFKRNGLFYDVIENSDKTIVFFCHFGMMTVLLSHLLNIPYTLLAQTTICLPTGVTTLISEEREKGIAQFRMNGFGDLSHLRLEGLEPSFNGRFCEKYEDDTRH